MANIAIETFDIDVGANGSTYILTNAAVGTDAAFVRLNSGTRKSSGGPIASTASIGPDMGNVGIELSGINTLTFHRSDTTTVKLIGEVWRYTGPPGGEHEFVVRAHTAVTISTGNASGSQAVVGIVNEDKCVPFMTGSVTSQASNSSWDQATIAVSMDGSGNVVASRNNTGGEITVYVDVVEFTGAAWNIGHGRSASHDSASETVALNTHVDGVSGSTFDTGDWSTALIEASMEGDSSETGLADTLALVYPDTSTSQVIFSVTDADAAAQNDGVGWVHVMQNSSLIVTRALDTNVNEGDGSYGTIAWPSGANTTRGADQIGLEWYTSTNGTGTAHMRGSLNARIIDPTGTIQHWVHRTGNTVIVRYGVVDVSGLVSQNATITGVSSITL